MGLSQGLPHRRAWGHFLLGSSQWLRMWPLTAFVTSWQLKSMEKRDLPTLQRLQRKCQGRLLTGPARSRVLSGQGHGRRGWLDHPECEGHLLPTSGGRGLGSAAGSHEQAAGERRVAAPPPP